MHVPLDFYTKVVFTFQKEGRCNEKAFLQSYNPVVFTFQKEGRCNSE